MPEKVKRLSDLDVKTLELVRDHLESMCEPAILKHATDLATDGARHSLIWKAARRSVIEDFNNAIALNLNNKRAPDQ